MTEYSIQARYLGESSYFNLTHSFNPDRSELIFLLDATIFGSSYPIDLVFNQNALDYLTNKNTKIIIPLINRDIPEQRIDLILKAYEITRISSGYATGTVSKIILSFQANPTTIQNGVVSFIEFIPTV